MNEITAKINHLLKAQFDLIKKRESGEKLISAIADYMGHTMTPLADQVMSQRVDIDSYLKDIASEIESIQSKCDHEFFYSYSDSRHSYHICQICNKTDKL